MNTKVILVGFIVVIAAVAGAVVVTVNQASDKGNDVDTSMDLNGNWYTIDGRAYINDVGFEDLNSEKSKLPMNLMDFRIDESMGNVFYGVALDQRMTGTYFDDGRILFEFVINTSLGIGTSVFYGSYDNGLIYGVTIVPQELDGEIRDCAVTCILSKDPRNDTKLQDVPDIKGQWRMYDSCVLTSDKTDRFDNGTLTVENEANKGLFLCHTVTNMKEMNDESSLMGVILNVPINGKYLGFMLDRGTKKLWYLTFDGHDLNIQTMTKMSPSDRRLSSISCSYATDGNMNQKEYPKIGEEVYYPEDSTFSTILNGVGKIVKSNSSFILNVVKQSGPAFTGTLMVDGSVFAFNGIMDASGRLVICYVYGDLVNTAFGVYKDGKIELGTFITTSTAGQSTRYVEMEPMPDDRFIENPDITGAWVLSSFASSGGVTETIFSPNVHRIPLFIASIENGIVKGRIFDTDFTGTYGPTTTGHGSIWMCIPYNGGVLSCELIVTHNDVLFATMTYEKDTESCQTLDMCQIIYTRDLEYSTIPNFRVDVFDKEWEAHRIVMWDGNKVTNSENPADLVKLSIQRTSSTGLGSFFNGTIEFTIPGSTDPKSLSFIGAFYEMGVYGNAIANIYGLESDCVSMSYFNKMLYIFGSFEGDGKLHSFHMLYKEKGAEAGKPYDAGYRDLNGKTFKNGDFSLTVTSQDKTFVYGTISVSFNEKVVKGRFIGLQMSIGGPIYIETVLLFNDGNVWDAHVVLIEDESSHVTQISFETVWYDLRGDSHAMRVIAKC